MSAVWYYRPSSSASLLGNDALAIALFTFNSFLSLFCTKMHVRQLGGFFFSVARLSCFHVDYNVMQLACIHMYMYILTLSLYGDNDLSFPDHRFLIKFAKITASFPPVPSGFSVLMSSWYWSTEKHFFVYVMVTKEVFVTIFVILLHIL